MAEEEMFIDPSELEEENESKTGRPVPGQRRFWKPALTFLIAAVIILSLSVAAVGLTIFFTHTLPATPAAQTVSTQCLTVQQNPSTTLLGSSGTVFYNCASPSGPIFSATGGSATPSFASPLGLVLSVVSFVSGASSCSGGTALASGVSISLPAGGYDYCGTFSSYPSSGFASFTVSWSQ